MRIRTYRHGQGGFTLIELLVVIAIIATLVAASTIMYGISQRAKFKATNTQRMNTIAAALAELKSPDNLGYVPSADIARLRGPDQKNVGDLVGIPNDTNQGIETLWVAFQLKGIRVNIDDISVGDAKGNTDDDELLEIVGELNTNDRFEFIDAYGNPFVYFSAKDYKDPKKVARYVLQNGDIVEAAPMTDPDTKALLNKSSFQLFSMGPDGKPNTEDDQPWGK